MLKFLKMDKLVESIARYLEARIELIKLDVQQEVANIIVKAIRIGLIAFMGLFALVFITIGLANLLNWAIGNPFIGYFIMAGVFLLIMGIGIAMQSTIHERVEQMTENMFTKKEEEDKEKQVEVVTPSTNGVKEETHYS
jgi:uncharacterized membrane protein YqjE